AQGCGDECRPDPGDTAGAEPGGQRVTESGAVLRVALGEYDIGWHDPRTSLDRADALVARAKAAGADLVVLPERCTTGFTMEPAGHCEPLTGESVTRLAEMARRHEVYLLAGVA